MFIAVTVASIIFTLGVVIIPPLIIIISKIFILLLKNSLSDSLIF